MWGSTGDIHLFDYPAARHEWTTMWPRSRALLSPVRNHFKLLALRSPIFPPSELDLFPLAEAGVQSWDSQATCCAPGSGAFGEGCSKHTPTTPCWVSELPRSPAVLGLQSVMDNLRS